MDPMQATVFILILFHLTNGMSGASLGNTKLFNETFDVEDEHREVIENIQKNYGSEFRNYEMADIENYLAGFMTPVKKEKKQIHTSKTFFGSDQFFGADERSKDDSHQQTWDPFRANRVIGSKPSYFDFPEELFQLYVYSKNNDQPSYSKTSYDFLNLPRGNEERSEIENNSASVSFKDEENELAPSKDKSSEDQFHQIFHVVNETKVDEFSHPVDDMDDFMHSLDDDTQTVDLSQSVKDYVKGVVDELSRSLEDSKVDVEKHVRPADEDVEDELEGLFRPADDVEYEVDVDYEDQSDNLSHPVNFEDQGNISHPGDENALDELSHSVHDDTKNEGRKLSLPVGDTEGQVNELDLVGKNPSQGMENSSPVDTTQIQVDELSTTEEGVLDAKDFHMHEITDKLLGSLSPSTVPGMDGELGVADDSTENQEDVFFQSAHGNESERREDLISEGDNDSELFLLHKTNPEKTTEDGKLLNMSNTKNSFKDPRNKGDILPLESNRNESRISELLDKHLEKVPSISDAHLMEFLERNLSKASIASNLDFHKMDIDEFEGSGDIGGSFDALADTLSENKSGRIIDIFPRVNNTVDCKTPKGERGSCRSLSQCPLSDPLNNFNLFLQYACLSRGVLVGICCPDNPVVEISDSVENFSRTPVTEFKQPVDGCGLNTNTRIVGGQVSLPHEWTWMVALLRRNRFFCGGVIINDWYILTAAHCVMGLKVRDLTVRLGEYNFSEKNEHQEDIPVAEIKRHALFVTLTFQHDIALLKLKRRIEYTTFVGSICLPNPKSGNFSNVDATVVGWGTVAFGGAASPVLRQVTVPVWDNDECDKTYRLEKITNAFMCAGSPENGEDACQGDSGGPLMTLNAEGRWEVIGIVSWGRRCGDPTFPGVYTRVTSYLNWITENAN